MKRSLSTLSAVAIFSLFCLASVQAEFPWPFGKSQEKPSLENLNITIRVKTDNQIFPAYIIAEALSGSAEETASGTEIASTTASPTCILGETDGMVQVRLRNPKSNTRVKGVFNCPEIMYESTFEGIMPEKGGEYTLIPKILWKFNALKKIRQASPLNIACDLSLDDQPVKRLAKTFTLRTINDCLFNYEDEDESHQIWWMYAAYVNENHPLLDPLMKEALNSGITTKFDGYQSDDVKEVYRQVYALWHVLENRKIRYSSIEKTSPFSAKVQSQHVRLLEESVNSSQANCVDGCVLLASLLRRCGIDAFLVTTPSHMFLGFYLDEDKTSKKFLETTVLNSPPEEEPAEDLELERLFGEDYKDRDSWQSFVQAIKSGKENYREVRQNLEDEDEDYGLIDIDQARSWGVLPIGSEK